MIFAIRSELVKPNLPITRAERVAVVGFRGIDLGFYQLTGTGAGSAHRSVPYRCTKVGQLFLLLHEYGYDRIRVRYYRNFHGNIVFGNWGTFIFVPYRTYRTRMRMDIRIGGAYRCFPAFDSMYSSTVLYGTRVGTGIQVSELVMFGIGCSRPDYEYY